MSLIPDTKPSLLMRLRDARDLHAWETFLEVYQPLILRLVRQKRVQEADAREVTQEVLLAVANSIHRWESDPSRGTFRAWLTTITRNLVVNFLIRQSRHPRGSGDSDVQQWINQQPSPDNEVSRWFDLERRRQIFRWAAEQVRAEFRETTWQAFWLTSVDGYEVVATAQQLKVTPGVVYVARSRVMKRIREKAEEFREQNQDIERVVT